MDGDRLESRLMSYRADRIAEALQADADGAGGTIDTDVGVVWLP
jgi:hypothetical protein